MSYGFLKVEMPGVEPGSEWKYTQASTCVVCLFELHAIRKPADNARKALRLRVFHRAGSVGAIAAKLI